MNVPSVDRSGSLAAHLLRRSRPRFWLYLGGTALVGLAWGADRMAGVLDPVGLALVAYFLLPANLFLYGVNDRFDRRTDAANPRKSDEGPEVRARFDRRADIAVWMAGLAGVALLPVLVPVAALALVGFLGLAIAYSAPPVRLKARPVLDSVSNGLYVLPGVAGYAVAAGTAPPPAVLLAAWLWTMAMHAFSAVPDVEPDRTANIRTTATLLGARRTLVAVAGVWALAAAAAAAHNLALGALFVVYPVVGTAIVITDVPVDQAYRWFPALNGFVGMVLTLGGLWRLTGGF